MLGTSVGTKTIAQMSFHTASTQSGRPETQTNWPKVGIHDVSRILFSALRYLVLNHNDNWSIYR